MFGCSMDELGIQSQKSQAMFENGGKDRIAASKSLLLGDLLTFLESYINKIVKKINKDYVFEFVGYEKEDPGMIADLDEKECRTYKTINEKWAEKGLEPLDLENIKNGADIPMNVQLVQLFQAKEQPQGEEMGAEGKEENSEESKDWEDYANDKENAEPAPDENENPEETESNADESDQELQKSFVMII